MAMVASIVAGSHIAPASTTPTPPAPIKIILAGDSITAQGSGWGGAFCAIHVSSVVACLPLGRGGRSSESYRAEGSWRTVLHELAVPGYVARYVVIAFGANDASHDPKIGTSPDAFAANLAQFVAEVRASGAEPILLTPLATRRFRNGKLLNTMLSRAAQVREVAARTNTPLVDLNRISSVLFQKMGATEALGFEKRQPSQAELRAALAGTTLPPSSPRGKEGDPGHTADYLHLNSRGAEAVATLIAPSLVAAVPALRGYVKS